MFGWVGELKVAGNVVAVAVGVTDHERKHLAVPLGRERVDENTMNSLADRTIARENGWHRRRAAVPYRYLREDT